MLTRPHREKEEFVINELHSLRELVISERYLSRSGSLKHNLTLGQCENLAGALFESHSSVTQIDFYCPASERRAGYYRWKRESPGKEYLTESEVQLRFIHLSFAPGII